MYYLENFCKSGLISDYLKDKAVSEGNTNERNRRGNSDL